MRLQTHISTALLFSTILVYNAHGTGCFNPISIALLFTSIFVSQVGLDSLGHTWVTYKGMRFPKRNMLHSLLGVTLWGLLFGFPFLFSCWLYSLAVLSGMYIHYLEDLVTEGGVYLWGRKRHRLPVRIRYDNSIANKFTILVFFLLSGFYVSKVFISPAVLPLAPTLYIYVVFLYSLFSFLAV